MEILDTEQRSQPGTQPERKNHAQRQAIAVLADMIQIFLAEAFPGKNMGFFVSILEGANPGESPRTTPFDGIYATSAVDADMAVKYLRVLLDKAESVAAAEKRPRSAAPRVPPPPL